MEKTNRANQQRKPRLLLNWDTTRKDLMEPFLQFGEDFEVTVVWGDPSEKERLSHPFRQIRFVDYATPYQLLNDVKPDSIHHDVANLAGQNSIRLQEGIGPHHCYSTRLTV